MIDRSPAIVSLTRAMGKIASDLGLLASVETSSLIPIVGERKVT